MDIQCGGKTTGWEGEMGGDELGKGRRHRDSTDAVSIWILK